MPWTEYPAWDLGVSVMVPGGSDVVVACGVGVRPGVGDGIGVSAGIAVGSFVSVGAAVAGAVAAGSKVVELTPHAVITKRIDRTTIVLIAGRIFRWRVCQSRIESPYL